MATDDERRRVAERMRCAAEQRQPYTQPTLACFIGADCMDIWTRLADLIEPARGSGGRAILCAHCESMPWCGCEPGDLEGGCDFEPRVDEGKPPYNLYSLYEAVFRRSPRDEFAIEDDEVRELVSELLDICNVPGHDLIKACDASQSCRDTVACDREPPGWTSFDERLPEPGAPVLCKGRNGAYYVGRPVTFGGERTSRVWVPHGAEYRSPVAWRPVDPPPCNCEALGVDP